MARGDVRSASYGRGGSGSGSYYDDRGRGRSRGYWEEFEFKFTNSGYSSDWLLGAGYDDSTLFNHVTGMTYRFNLHDWAFKKYEDSDDNDGRVRRLVVAKCGLDTWEKLQGRAKAVNERVMQEREVRNAERAAEYALERAAFEAQQIKTNQEEWEKIKQHSDFMVGGLLTEMNLVQDRRESHGRDEGYEIEDIVTAYTTGYGFVEDISTPTGIKLQVTVSLDCSNSMVHNYVTVGDTRMKLGDFASKVFLNLNIVLDQMKHEYGEDFYFAAFEFSDDNYDGLGKRATCVSHNTWDVDDNYRGIDYEDGAAGGRIGYLERYRSNGYHYIYSGEDTWFYPLFEQIEKWEKRSSDPRAARLDIILTDAVIEHPSDIRRSSEIQARRNGNLQSVFLNFLPEGELVNSDLPLRCTQYVANPDNVEGIVRKLIYEFVQQHM